jgi:hypothetical protein
LIRLPYIQHYQKEILKAMPDNYNYQNNGQLWEGLSKTKMPTFASPLSNKLMGTNNPMAGIAELAARGGAGLVTGGASEIIAQVLNLIPSIFQGITGASQMRKAARIEAQNPRPEATIAPSIEKLTDYAYGQTLNQDVPGGEMYRNEIKGATAAGMKAISELSQGSEGVGAMAEMVGRQQNQFGDLAKLTAQEVRGAKDVYGRSLEIKAGEENRVWDWNEAQPYMQAAQIAAALRDSGLKNINSGVKNIFGSGAEYLSSTNQDFNSSLMWGKGKNNGTDNLDLSSIMEAIKGLS